MSTASDIFSEPMDWLFWPPILPRTDSAWLGHVPFAYWIVGVHKPRQIVELGTLSGSSYASFCDSAVRHGVTTKAFARTACRFFFCMIFGMSSSSGCENTTTRAT